MRIGIYCNSFTGDDPGNQQIIDDLKSSGFNTVVIWAIQVWDDGTIVWNQQPFVQNGQLLVTWWPAIVQALKTPPTTIDTVLFSIGAGGVDTFTHIQTALSSPASTQALIQNFQALTQAIPLDGYDFDDEDNYDQATVTRLAEILCTPDERIVTFCPWEQPDFWAGCLPPLYAWGQQQIPQRGQPVQWMNVQCYGGGGPNANASQQVQTFVSAITGATGGSSTGLPYGDTYSREFIAAGLAVANNNYGKYYSPYDIETTFQALPGVSGGWLWNSASITGANGYNFYDYALAVITGLNAANLPADQRPRPVRRRRAQGAEEG